MNHHMRPDHHDHHRCGPHGGGHRGFGRHEGPGRFGPLDGGWGPGGPRGGRGPRGRRARRGDVRLALLLLLAEEPRNGYGLMQELEARTDGAWRPSPGSVYPALAQLADEELVRAEGADGRSTYAITDAGRAHLAERPEGAPAPWEAMAPATEGPEHELREQLGQLAAAVKQAAQAGTPAQVTRVSEALAETRRSVYRVLAEEPEAS